MSTTIETKSVVMEVTPNGTLLYHCPGCHFIHGLNTDMKRGKPVWKWNGDLGNPTVTPSVLYCGTPRCHGKITDGEIEFFMDCDHSMRGRKVRLKPITDFQL